MLKDLSNGPGNKFNPDDFIGVRFGRLTVIEKHDNRNVVCECDCGSILKALMFSLNKGNKKSCGCLQADVTRIRSTKHGKDQRGKRTPEYNCWCHIKQRCRNPDNGAYPYYGGRGIDVCDEWYESFMAFYEHVGDRPARSEHIDRIDNTKGYFPGNVRWVTQAQNNRNKSNSRVYVIDGKEYASALDASKVFGVNPQTIVNWCTGNKRRGGEPRNGCSFYMVYPL